MVGLRGKAAARDNHGISGIAIDLQGVRRVGQVENILEIQGQGVVGITGDVDYLDSRGLAVGNRGQVQIQGSVQAQSVSA